VLHAHFVEVGDDVSLAVSKHSAGAGAAELEVSETECGEGRF
jgi:hypothetical protein